MLLATIVVFNITKYLNNKNNTIREMTYRNTKIDYAAINTNLDVFINDNLNELLIFNEEYLKYANIPESLVNQMPKDLSMMVLTRMSDILRAQLEIVYKKEKLTEVVTRRCIAACIDYTTNYNSKNNGNSENNMVNILK